MTSLYTTIAALWLCLLAIHFSAAAPDKAPKPPDKPKLEAEKPPVQEPFLGRWKANGKQIQGDASKDYEADVQIHKDAKNGRLLVIWTMESGHEILGAALIEGDNLVVGWSLVTPTGHHRGVTIYKIGVVMEGRWTMMPGGIGTETLTRPPPVPDTD